MTCGYWVNKENVLFVTHMGSGGCLGEQNSGGYMGVVCVGIVEGGVGGCKLCWGAWVKVVVRRGNRRHDRAEGGGRRQGCVGLVSDPASHSLCSSSLASRKPIQNSLSH